MAADVLMGNDPDCGRWILTQSRARRPRARSAADGSTDAPWSPPADGTRRRWPIEPLVIFTPSGGAAGSPRARRSSTRRARSASTSTRSAAGAASAAAARSTQGVGEFPSTASRPRPTTCPPFAELETTYRDEKGLAADRRLSCTATVCGDVLVDVPPESQVHRQVVRKGLDVRDVRGRPGRPAALRRGRAAGARVADRRPRAAVRGARARVGADRPRGRPRGHPRAPARARGRASTASPSPSTTAARSSASGRASTNGLRRRHRRRLDDHRRPPGRPRRRRGPRERRRDEPADPLRRGPDEPGVVRDDASRGRRRDDRGRARGARRAGRLARDAGRHQARPRSSRSCSSATRSCTTSCWASTRCRSGGAPFALATDRPSGRPPRSSGCGPTRARASTCCRASPATSAPTRPGVILAEAPHRAERMTLVVDVGTNAEIVLGDQRPAARRIEPDRPGLRGRPDLRRAARRARRHRARPHRPRDARAALPGHRRRRLVRRARRSRPRSPRPGITGICGSGIIEVVAELFLAGVIDADGVVDGATGRALAADRRRTAAPSLRPARGDRRRAADRHHPERRPGDPARQGGALRRASGC